MDALTTAAASGMRARMETLDILANNIANSPTPGFKADREFYNIYVSASSLDSAPGPPPVSAPLIEKHWTDFSQGALSSTGNPLDVALAGKGFLVAATPSGRVLTRDGGLRLSRQGELETKDGYLVQSTTGKSIRVEAGKLLEIGRDGALRQDGAEIGRLALVDVQEPAALIKKGQNYFSLDPNGTTVPAAGVEVQQGQLEASNTQPAENAVRLVGVMRQFEMLQRASAIGFDMNRKSVQEVARVTS